MKRGYTLIEIIIGMVLLVIIVYGLGIFIIKGIDVWNLLRQRNALQAELTEKLTAELSIYKCPRRFVYLDEMPMTATGKVQRFRLREIVQQAGSEP